VCPVGWYKWLVQLGHTLRVRQCRLCVVADLAGTEGRVDYVLLLATRTSWSHLVKRGTQSVTCGPIVANEVLCKPTNVVWIKKSHEPTTQAVRVGPQHCRVVTSVRRKTA
jgi:hypothetical protein